MTTQYNINEITKGRNGFGLPFSDNVASAALAAAADTSLIVPLSSAMGSVQASANRYVAVFSYAADAEVYVALNAAAAAPAGAAFAAGSELNPSAKVVKAGDTIHLLSTAGAQVSVAFYAIQEA
ncbi:MAG TPA: hypothetical protein ENG03_05320 [Thioploca sp.]|nr:MAG: hypothetical protein DRQ44_00595 [Gammaproteobacteria bacterium]HDN26505.1 hypothetical protein [Thioploca sp.]